MVESAEKVSEKMVELQAANTNGDAVASHTMVLAGRKSAPYSMGLTGGKPAATTTVVLAQRIIKNAFNFLASFAGNVPVPGSSGTAGVEVVPLKAFQDWWIKFESKVKNDPTFLEKDVD